MENIIGVATTTITAAMRVMSTAVLGGALHVVTRTAWEAESHTGIVARSVRNEMSPCMCNPHSNHRCVPKHAPATTTSMHAVGIVHSPDTVADRPEGRLTGLPDKSLRGVVPNSSMERSTQSCVMHTFPSAYLRHQPR